MQLAWLLHMPTRSAAVTHYRDKTFREPKLRQMLTSEYFSFSEKSSADV